MIMSISMMRCIIPVIIAGIICIYAVQYFCLKPGIYLFIYIYTWHDYVHIYMSTSMMQYIIPVIIASAICVYVVLYLFIYIYTRHDYVCIYEASYYSCNYNRQYMYMCHSVFCLYRGI